MHRLREHRSSRPRSCGGGAMTTTADAPTTKLVGAARQARRGPEPDHGCRQVPRRPQAAGNDPRGDRCARRTRTRGSRASTRRRRPLLQASSPSSPARTSRTCPPLPCAWQAGGVENFVNTPRALEIDRVTFTGAGVAAVVAETQVRGRGRARADRRRLRAARRRRRRRGGGRPTARRSCTRTRRATSSWTGPCGDAEATDSALAEAEVVVEQRLVNQRLIPTPMEARGAAADLRAVHRPVHGLDDLAGPAHHAAADDGVRVRDPRDEDALHRARTSAAASGRRSSSTTSTCSWPPSPRRSAGRSSGSRRGARTTRRRRTAATTSPTSRSGRSATARSPR